MCLIFISFSFKLSGNAAIKSKNVYLSMADKHQSLCRRGIVQLFNHPHPPKQYQTIWTSKTPPRIYTQNELRQRMSRSTEDLNKYRIDNNDTSDSTSIGGNSTQDLTFRTSRSSSKCRHQQQNMQDDATIGASIERSTSLHSNVQKSQNQIILPKDYNPIAALNAVENMEVFLSKTFYKSVKSANVDITQTAPAATTKPSSVSNDEGINAFTNKIFTECYEEKLMKDSKRLHNLNHKNLVVQSSTRNYKQLISNHRHRELQVVACIIVELFLAHKLRPLGIGSMQKLNDRIEACKNVLKMEFESLPKCVQYPIKLLFSLGNGTPNQTITDIGMPKLSAHQMLQPFLSNFLFPFPFDYLNVYTLLKTLYQYESANKLLDLYTYFECDRSSDCKKFITFSKQRTLYKRKIAECKVMACGAQIERLFVPHGYEQFDVVELVLPHIIDLLRSENTSILAAWFLFDSAAVALGQTKTQKYLLEPILKLYDAESDERTGFMNNSFDSSTTRFTTTSFKSRKTIKLYHHSFLLRLIVRFGLNCFLTNFVPPLIEAIGGCKEQTHHSFYHCHENHENNSPADTNSTKLSNKSLASNNDSSAEEIATKKNNNESDEMFTFENEGDDLQKAAASINLTDSSDNDIDTISRIIDQFETNSNDGKTILV